MSLYNMLFGRNGQTPLLLAVIGLRESDIERFRDVSAEGDGSEITVLTRTGGGNRDDFPNEIMRHRPEWLRTQDDSFDPTYCTDDFRVPDEWQRDVANLRDLLKHGIRPEFAQHLAATLQREPTEGDREAAARQAEAEALRRVPHTMANGHTFVPHSDAAMRVALQHAEQNGGAPRSCWWIAPLVLRVERDADRYGFDRVRVSSEWQIDEAYWQRCQEQFGNEYPQAMARIAETVERNRERRPA